MDYKQEVAKRWEQCKSCEFYKYETKQCSKCGCFMFIKIFLPQASCPVNKW